MPEGLVWGKGVPMEGAIETLTRGNVAEVKIVLASIVAALAVYQVTLMAVRYVLFWATWASIRSHPPSGGGGARPIGLGGSRAALRRADARLRSLGTAPAHTLSFAWGAACASAARAAARMGGEPAQQRFELGAL